MKPIQPLLLLLSALLAPSTFSQAWTQTAAPSAAWYGAASSADGARLAAAFRYPSPGGIALSTNAGVTWQTNDFLGANRVASSADGMTLAVAAGGDVFVSTNGGGAWSGNLLGQDLSGIATSADGTKIIVVDPSGNGGHIFVSTDSGLTWATNALAGRNWTAIAASADGRKWIATASSGGPSAGIYTSVDGGSTWVSNTVSVPSPAWQCAASSADGMKLAAGIGGNGGYIYTSTNGGNSWVPRATPIQVWISLASSADGSRLIAASSFSDDIYTSTNFGSTWVSNNIPRQPWSFVASSADGDSLIAVINNPAAAGSIYISHVTPSPQLSLAPADGNLELAWTIPSTNFIAQSSVDLAGWTDLTNAPSINLTNLAEQITLPLSGSNAFFRLAAP